MKAARVTAEWAPREGYPLTEFERDNRRAIDGNQVWRNPSWSVTEVDIPEITKPDHVLLKVKACGMCGSDVHMYERDADDYIMLSYRTKFPCTLGHEFSGEVVAVGSEVQRFREGDAVAVEEINYCGFCRACRGGYFNQCPNAEDIGFTVDGAYAEYIVVRERYCWSLNPLREIYDDAKVYEIGALIEPTGVAYQGTFVRTGGFKPGEHVAVFGCGPIGLAAIQMARAAGADRIVAFEVQDSRRELALECGANATFDPIELTQSGSRPAEQVMEITRGEGIALAVEASGYHQAVFPEIEDCLDYGGKVAAIGVMPESAPVRFIKYQLTAASLYGSLGHCGGDFGRIINMHAAGTIDMTKIVTKRYNLADTVEAVEATSKRIDAKVLVKP